MSATIVQCCLCRQPISTPALSIGPVPISNRFRPAPAEDYRISLDVVECETCRLIQLRRTAPIDELVPRLPWIRYREPEGHLNDLIGTILAMLPNARSLLGAGPFEQPLISLANACGIRTAALTIDAGTAKDRYPYLETWQASLNERRLLEASTQLGTFDIVSCRYIVEHSTCLLYTSPSPRD